MTKKTVLFLLGLLASSIFCSSSFAAFGEAFYLPPSANYQKIKTDHFEVIFPGDYEREGKLAAAYLEQAHATLAPYYAYTPGHRTTVILIDNQDFANGAASAVGLQGLFLFMVRPDPYSSIGEYEHWLQNLVIHEYAHYLTLEQTNGIFSFLRILFGNAIFPNHFWPTWLAEGIAVHAESTFTKAGRGYGAYFGTITRDALYRKRLGSDDFLAYKRLMGPVPDFPFGESYYFAGYGIIDEMINQYGKDAPARYSTRSSRRVPYFLDGGVKGLDGGRVDLGFRELWEAWIRRQARKLKPELDWLEAHGTPDPEFLTPEGISTKGSRFSPDGSRVAFVVTATGHDRPSVQVVNVRTKEIRKLDEAVSGVGLGWSRDGKKLYYAKTDFNGPFAFYSDLYEYYLEDDSSARLTHDERAKDPDFCAGKLVYVTQRGRFSEVRSFDLATKKIATVYRSPENHHVAIPRCTPDGQTVYFSEHGTQPLDLLRSARIDGSDVRHVAGGPDKGFGALYPQPLANGDVLFTRVKNGYYELARWNMRQNAATVLARSSGGYWLPSVASRGDRAAVTYVSSTGIRTGLLDLKDNGALSGVDKAPYAQLSPDKLAAAPVPNIQTRTKGYNLLTSLAPRIWSPHLLLTDSGSQVGFSLIGWDDVDIFQYGLNVFYDGYRLDRLAGQIFTRTRVSTFRLGLYASSLEDGVTSLPNNRLAIDEERTVGVLLARPIPSTFWNLTPALIAEWARIWRHTDDRDDVLRPEVRLGADLAFDNRARFAHSITAERGTQALLQGRRLFAGDDIRAWKAMLTWQQIVPLVPRHGNLSLTGYGAFAPSPKRELSESDIRIGGQGEQGDLNPPLRGYRLGSFNAKRAGVIQAEYRVPVFEFFRGFGNWPIFLRNLGVFGFYDGTKFQEVGSGDLSPWISSAGGGLLLNTAFGYQAPLQIRLEYAHGFKRSRNGEDIVSFLVGF